ncbi:hypothetical protein B0H19DRAFT_146001 [Mycena capillaripes]|nr:hypothetical protein B0H19DRAFT_146001 [Mycena capillaripes]
MDCPILVWMLSLNRDYNKEEYDAFYKIVKDGVPHLKISYDPERRKFPTGNDPDTPAAYDAASTCTSRTVARLSHAEREALD